MSTMSVNDDPISQGLLKSDLNTGLAIQATHANESVGGSHLDLHIDIRFPQHRYLLAPRQWPSVTSNSLSG